ncbi:hypothetical protein B7R21_07595 [Subtercola boreus]|uniref:Uncharacterized protein n=1 Tax=Subtercola boreus TaxID=120213 RepID=A0A3E0VVP9_9MICO|nr:MazG-like family protein [Subtercola boreus]RFA13916.1 hypothetical protein B7R21_07595 [Subtercola boreus]
MVDQPLKRFQWSPDAARRRLRDELADVLTYCLLLADRIGADLAQFVGDSLNSAARGAQSKSSGRASPGTTPFDVTSFDLMRAGHLSPAQGICPHDAEVGPIDSRLISCVAQS